MSSVSDKFTSVLRQFLELCEKTEEAKNIKPTDRFGEDYGFDSLDHIELLLAVEEEFEIDIEDGVTDNIKTVAEAIQFMEGRIQ